MKISQLIVSLVSVFPEPAAPGALTTNRLPGPDVKLQFNRSAGHVDKYTATILSLPPHIQHITENLDTRIQTVTFRGLTQGAYYNVSIVAIINPDQPSITIKSDTVVYEFRVKANSEFS